MTAPALPAPLPAFRQLARPCQAPGCPNVRSRANVDGYCDQCHADRTLFDASGALLPEQYKPCARCHEGKRAYGGPYCRREMSLDSHRRRKARELDHA